ncbi:NADH oxidase [Streptomyces sp. NPDC020807]|uniref:NADH oxidase n=1 Tax=Streptomyces sp. NPDC020807 TaxID=3155119 RepID=UPI0034072D42
MIPAPEDAPLRLHHLWSLHEDTAVGWDEEGQALLLSGPQGTERIEAPASVVAEALHRMEMGPIRLANLLPPPDASHPAAGDTRHAGQDGYTAVLSVLRDISHLVIRTLSMEDLKGPVLSVVPARRTARFVPAAVPPQRTVGLRAGVTITVRGNAFWLESRTLEHRVEIHRPEAMWVVSLLAWPTTPDALVEVAPLPAELTLAILAHLAGAGMTVTGP